VRTIKQTIVGNGNASKQQIQNFVQNLLYLNQPPQQDAADALAIAMCHAIHLNK
jgi:crossover junction endodeoxyribonuclease RuvC